MRLSADHLSFSYTPAKPVLCDVSLECAPHAITVLLGANGAGKSTLFKLFAGILQPQAGSIRLDETDIQTFSRMERARRIGALLQVPTPAFDIAVRDFILFGRTPKLPRFSKPTEADFQAVQQAMECLDLLPFADTSIRHLSGGEYQRVRIAAALALESDVLLLDEPTTAQDPKYARFIGDVLTARATAGRTIAVITHDLAWTERFATHAILLANGMPVAQGSPRETITEENLRRIF